MGRKRQYPHRLFHLTHQSNVPRIKRYGLLPNKETGYLYFCTADAVAEIAEHVADHHGWKLSEMVTLSTLVWPADLKKYRRKGVYRSKSGVPNWAIYESQMYAVR